MKRLARRSFLRMAGGSAMLAYFLERGILKAQSAPGAKRLLIVSRPNGTIDEDWLPNNRRGSILEPFAQVWPYAVALRGVRVTADRVTDGDPHSLGSITTMTAAPRNPETIPGNDNHWNTVESLDQRLARESSILSGTRIPSLQLGAWIEGPSGDEPSRALSFRGAASPLYPETNPNDLYRRLFADMMPGGDTSSNQAELERLRVARGSVLDYVRADLARVREQLPGEVRPDLGAHEEAIRELETNLDQLSMMPEQDVCTPPGVPSGLDLSSDRNTAVGPIGAAMFAILKATFVCDLTRVATFMWAGGAGENIFPSLGSRTHHNYSHADNRPVLSSIDRWYSEQTAPLIESLIDAADPVAGGKLIDNTLVWYLSEIAEGWNHRLTDMPYILFGGDGVGLERRSRVLEASGSANSNDIWLSLAPQFGVDIEGALRTPSNGPIAGLFAAP